MWRQFNPTSTRLSSQMGLSWCCQAADKETQHALYGPLLPPTSTSSPAQPTCPPPTASRLHIWSVKWLRHLWIRIRTNAVFRRHTLGGAIFFSNEADWLSPSYNAHPTRDLKAFKWVSCTGCTVSFNSQSVITFFFRMLQITWNCVVYTVHLYQVLSR